MDQCLPQFSSDELGRENREPTQVRQPIYRTSVGRWRDIWRSAAAAPAGAGRALGALPHSTPFEGEKSASPENNNPLLLEEGASISVSWICPPVIVKLTTDKSLTVIHVRPNRYRPYGVVLDLKFLCELLHN